MLALLKGFKVTFLSLLSAGLVYVLAVNFHGYWQSWLPIMPALQYVLLGITVLFSAQFNRSRFTLLATLWLLLLVGQSYTLPDWLLLVNSPQWLLLSGAVLAFVLAVIKDRALLSMYGVKRVVYFTAAIILAFIWLLVIDSISPNISSDMKIYQIITWLPVVIPLAIIGCFIIMRSIMSGNLFLASLLLSYVVWCDSYFHFLALPSALLKTLLACFYLLAVVIDAYFLAYRDELTGLASRRALNQYVLSLGRKYTLAMLDIDHFKKFNDTYGHDVGDQVLKLVASKLNKVKGGGRAFRYGGEEFTIVFPKKDLVQAQAELDRLRQVIADYQMVIRQVVRKSKDARKSKPARSTSRGNRKNTVSITISIGVAQRESKQGFRQVITLADEALYRAKKNGRNNVSL